jgi:hypothetical protein
MNMNRIRVNVRKNVNCALSTVLGVITKSEADKSKIHNDAGLAKNVYFEREAERVSMEAEVKKAQACQLVQSFQKC